MAIWAYGNEIHLGIHKMLFADLTQRMQMMNVNDTLPGFPVDLLRIHIANLTLDPPMGQTLTPESGRSLVSIGSRGDHSSLRKPCELLRFEVNVEIDSAPNPFRP